jgi:hypothetical protein
MEMEMEMEMLKIFGGAASATSGLDPAVQRRCVRASYVEEPRYQVGR